MAKPGEQSVQCSVVDRRYTTYVTYKPIDPTGPRLPPKVIPAIHTEILETFQGKQCVGFEEKKIASAKTDRFEALCRATNCNPTPQWVQLVGTMYRYVPLTLHDGVVFESEARRIINVPHDCLIPLPWACADDVVFDVSYRVAVDLQIGCAQTVQDGRDVLERHDVSMTSQEFMDMKIRLATLIGSKSTLTPRGIMVFVEGQKLLETRDLASCGNGEQEMMMEYINRAVRYIFKGNEALINLVMGGITSPRYSKDVIISNLSALARLLDSCDRRLIDTNGFHGTFQSKYMPDDAYNHGLIVPEKFSQQKE